MNYQKTIRDITGCDRDDAVDIENLMRDTTGGVLDGLSAAEFQGLALLAQTDLRDHRDVKPGWRHHNAASTLPRTGSVKFA